MAEAIVTKIAKQKILQARAGIKSLPPIVGMAFGIGGIKDGQIINPSEWDVSLRDEVLRKEVDGYDFLEDTRCRYTCTLAVGELSGLNINELGLYGSEGDLLAIKTFLSKGKDMDMEMAFVVDDIY